MSQLARVFGDYLQGEMLVDVVGAVLEAVEEYVRQTVETSPDALAAECRAAMRPARSLLATIEAAA